MSSLIVEVCRIEKITPHANADALELAVIKGWQCVVPREKYKPGDKVVYVPVDSLLPASVHEPMGITKYLSNGRVRCAKLRGEPSFGVILDPADPAWEVGRDVAAHYGITKYIPPLKVSAGDAAPDDPRFPGYTEVENLRNFPEIFIPGELVIATEKLHGTNQRTGLIDGEWMAGSRELRRQVSNTPESNLYWFPSTLPPVKNLMEALAAKGHRHIVLFGEVFGSKVQNLNYGHVGKLGYAAFDLYLDGRYADVTQFEELCAAHDVPTVPLLFRGPYTLDAIKVAATGSTSVGGAAHVREGVVVKPLLERTDPKIGRVILKYLNDDCLLKKEEGRITDSTDS
jgi:RNA ligase (TIGR02306 family)